MQNTAHHLRRQSIATLHDIQGWSVGEQLKQLQSSLMQYEVGEAGFHQDKNDGSIVRYVWRTQGDNKVRGSHAANNNRIFSQGNLPTTGHPGEDFGCRCWAEPLDGNEYVRQTLLTVIKDNPDKWGTLDFAQHYYFGKGVAKTLHGIGYLGDVINHYSKTLGVYDRLNQQIINEAREKGEGSFIYSFFNFYEFAEVAWELAGSTVGGIFVGEARKKGDFLVISGIITYQFYDDFADPYQIIEAIQYVFQTTREEVIAFLEDTLGVNVDFSGTPYAITDRWQTKFNATIEINE